MLIVNGRQASIDLGDNEGPFRFARGSTSEPTHPASGLRERALVQMDRSDRLSWYAELAEVDNERAEGRGGAVQRPPLRSGDRHPVRALVSSIQAEFARPGRNDWPSAACRWRIRPSCAGCNACFPESRSCR